MFKKIVGGEVLQSRPDVKTILRGFAGGFLGIIVLLLITRLYGVVSIMAPLGATCVLLFAVPKSPLAQPRNIIGGHLISTLIGLLTINLFGDGMLPIAFAVGASIALMQLLRVVHAPAGANPLLIIMSGTTNYSFLLTPVLIGSVLLVIIALVINNIGIGTRWPCYWFGYQLSISKRKIKSKKE